MSSEAEAQNGRKNEWIEFDGFRISLFLLDLIMEPEVDRLAVRAQAVTELGPVEGQAFLTHIGQSEPGQSDAGEAHKSYEEQEPPPGRPQPGARGRQVWTWDAPDLSLIPDENAAALRFPVEIFGPFWADWCRKSARDVGAVVNFTAGTLLATVGGMLGNVRWAQGSNTWKQPSILWVALIGPSATAKTPSMGPVVDLIQEILERRRAEHEALADQRDLEDVIALSYSHHWAMEVKTAAGIAYKNNTPLPNDLPKRPKLGKRPAELVAHSLFFDDVTIESVTAHAVGLPRGFIVKTDELSTWFGSFTRYSSGSGQGARGYWNKAFDGAYYRVGRKSQDLRGVIRAQTDIPRLSIGILGGTHPDEIRDLLSRDGKLSDDGMAHRFLWVWGQNLSADALEVSGSVSSVDNARALSALVALDKLEQQDGYKPVYVRATPEAEAVLLNFKKRMAREAHGKTPWRRSSLNKAPGIALRISNVLTYLRWSADHAGPQPTLIELDVMQDAIWFVETYCLANAERLQKHVATADAEGDARGLIKIIQEQNWDRFHMTDIKRRATQRLSEGRYRDVALEILTQAGLIKPDFQRQGETKGRMREEYVVNPQVHAAAAAS